MSRLLPIAAVVVVSLLSSSSTRAQDDCDCSGASRTSLLGDARYEMLTAKNYPSYRLDRYTGELARLERSSSRFTSMTIAWKTLPLPPEDPPTTARVNYQLLLPYPREPLLTNVHSGATWVLRSAAGDVKWEAVAVEKLQ